MNPMNEKRSGKTQDIANILRDNPLGAFLADETPRFTLPNVDTRDLLRQGFSLYLRNRMPKGGFVWLPEYDEVADWLTDNEGRGLLLYGGCGQGKTLLAKWVIPLIFMYLHKKVFRTYDSRMMNENLQEILKCSFITLDDVGTETLSDYRDIAFAEITDMCEKKGRMLIVTSNLDAKGLQERYGQRVLDRLTALTRRVAFLGPSLRA